jgi:metal-responsive CopG/Arc/MetJ family transcriptional regulator
MSNANHDGETKLTFWIDTKTVEEFDKILTEYGYKSRAEWLRAQLRVEIDDYRKLKASQK